MECSDHIDTQPTTPPTTANKIAQQWVHRINKRQEFRSPDRIAKTTTNLPQPRQYIIGIDDNILRSGMEDGSIPSTVADSACTLGVGTEADPCPRTGRASHKQFFLPGGEIKQATEVAEYPFKVQEPVQELHITPGITKNLLLSTNKFAAANYIIIFDKDEVNIYDTNDTIITVARGVILHGWMDTKSNLWHIPLVEVVWNNSTDTIIVNQPPTEFLPARPPPTDAIHNVYKLKTQPELVRYYHTPAGFSTKPTWLKAIENKQYASWPDLSIEAVTPHYPDTEETPKGHGRKSPSNL